MLVRSYPLCVLHMYNVLVLLLIIPLIMRAAGEMKLLCSDRNFLVHLREPTVFCQMQG